MKATLKSTERNSDLQLEMEAIDKINATGQLVLVTMRNGKQYTGRELEFLH